MERDYIISALVVNDFAVSVHGDPTTCLFMKCILLTFRLSLVNSLDKLFAIFTLGLNLKEILFRLLFFSNFLVMGNYILAEYKVTMFISDVLLCSELDQLLIVLVILPNLVILMLFIFFVSLLIKTLLT